MTVLALLASPGIASAGHNLERKWIVLPNGCTDHFVQYAFKNSVPTGSFRTRINEGSGLWNAVDTELRFAHTVLGDPNVRVWVAYQVPPSPHEGALGSAVLNAFPFWEVHHADIYINPTYDSDWYLGSSSPVPQNKYDVRTLAGHEFGHLVALKHGYNSDIMRPVQGKGQRYVLSTHDRAGIQAYYPDLTC